MFIVYELSTWSEDLNADFTLRNSLFRAVKLTENVGPDKYSYSGYGITCDSHSLFSLLNFNLGKNVIIFGVDNSRSVHIDNKKPQIFWFLVKVQHKIR